MPQTLLELAGDAAAPVLHIAPANGFPPQTYLPMLRGLSAKYRVVCCPPRALWGDQAPPAELRDWRMVADDLLAAFERWRLRDIVAVGHSLGGIASLLAVLQEPARFKALAMLDPVMLMPDALAWFKSMIDNGSASQSPLIQAAMRRRRHFVSREQAFQRFRAKSSFADWTDAALRLYVEHGLRARADGPGFELTWTIEWEIYYYSTIYQPIWQVLHQLDGLLPILMIRGENSDTFTEESLHLARSTLRSAELVTLEGQGHLFPQAAPDAAAPIIADWLADAVKS